MTEIKKANIDQIPQIVDLAYNTWFKTYENIISKEQIDFMFGEMYSPEAIYKQMDFMGHDFYIFYDDSIPTGFASLSQIYHEVKTTYKIHKLYFLPECQGKGFGKEMLNFIEQEYKSRNAECLILNVNRNNPAYHFYLKMNFKVRESVDIPYGDFWLNDYVLEKNILQ